MIVTAIVAGALGYVGYQVSKFTLDINNPTGLAKRDIHKLEKALEPLVTELVKLSDKEVELLSLTHDSKKSRTTRFNQYSGFLTSIYHEKLVAFSFRVYNKKEVSTLLVQTSEEKFFYISMKGETRVYFNDKPFGVIRNDGTILSSDGRTIYGQIQPQDVLLLHPISIKGKEVAAVVNPKHADAPNPRAFEYVEYASESQRVIVLCLSLFTILEESFV